MPVVTDHSLSTTKKILRDTFIHRIHIIVEVQIFLIQTRNPVKMHLYRIAVERRQELLGNNVLVKHYLEIGCIRPFRYL